MYILQRDDGLFVAPLGEPKAYTRDLQRARVFTSRDAAERDKCGNETVRRLEDLVSVEVR